MSRRPACEFPKQPSKGFSLIEVLVGALILGVVFCALISLLVSGSKLGSQEMEFLGMQLDAQRSLVQFLWDLEEAMAVILPQPGQTLPYAMIRDKLNRLAFYSLVPGPEGSAGTIRRSLSSSDGVETKTVIQGVRRVTFTALSDSALRFHITYASGERELAFYSQIRLRNRDAAEI